MTAVILGGMLITWAAVAVVQASIDRHRWKTSPQYRDRDYWEKVREEAALHIQADQNIRRREQFDAHVAAELDRIRRGGR